MSGPVRALFVTYSMLAAPGVGPSMIGALKRCLRLVACLPAEEIEPLWIHSGPVFRQDPLVREVAARLPRYDSWGRLEGPWRMAAGERFWRASDRLSALPALNLPRVALGQGLPLLYQAHALRRLLARLRPDVVVLGDNPLNGLLRRASRVARELGIPQVGIDDHLSRWQHESLARSSPQVDRWLLVGIPFDGRLGRLSPSLAVAPPLLPGAPAAPAERTDLTIFGYDPHIARLGLDFLARLPAGTTARLISTGLSDAQRRDFAERAAGRRLSFVPFPTDGEFRACLASSALVFCKNGFQQIVETLAVGTPAIAVPVAGGVPECFLDDDLRPYVHYLSGWEDALALARSWMAERPRPAWVEDLDRLESPVRHGAALLADLVRDAAERAVAA
ncbi:MAG: hypothetical protein ABUT39_06055 [Acidobacteriota bacterium]